MDAQVFEGGSRQALAWLADHRVFGRLLLPAAAMMEMLASAVSEAMHWPRPLLSDFVLRRPCQVPELEEGNAIWQVVVKQLSADCAEADAVRGHASTGNGGCPEWLSVAGRHWAARR